MYRHSVTINCAVTERSSGSMSSGNGGGTYHFPGLYRKAANHPEPGTTVISHPSVTTGILMFAGNIWFSDGTTCIDLYSGKVLLTSKNNSSGRLFIGTDLDDASEAVLIRATEHAHAGIVFPINVLRSEIIKYSMFKKHYN